MINCISCGVELLPGKDVVCDACKSPKAIRIAPSARMGHYPEGVNVYPILPCPCGAKSLAQIVDHCCVACADLYAFCFKCQEEMETS